MSASPFIIRFSDAALQPERVPEDRAFTVRRVVGTVEMKHLLPLFHDEALTPNPRSARVNRVTADVLKSLESTPELFASKSKGILLGTSAYELLQRNRYRVTFKEPSIEGILDGGHNMLAFGLFMLQDLMEERDHKAVKSWDDLLKVWSRYKAEVEKRKEEFSILVPLEMLIPAREDDDTIEMFHSALVDICSARNNNVQLPNEASANKKGYFDELRDQVPKELADRTEWKPNTWEDAEETRPVKPRDLVALSWIPLNLLSEESGLPGDLKVSPQNIYRNKGECQRLFEDLMSQQGVTEKSANSKHILIHEGLRSAFKIAGDLPELYDLIYEEFPDAYNEHNRRFRANPIVKLYDPQGRKDALAAGKEVSGFTATLPLTPFMRRPVRARSGSKPCSYPEGLIVPLVYGLQGIMQVHRGKVRWAVDDPAAFVRSALPLVAGSYQLVLEMAKWDPQKIAKQPESHQFAVQQFRNALRAK